MISWYHLCSPGPCGAGLVRQHYLASFCNGNSRRVLLAVLAFFSHLKGGERRWCWRRVHTYSLVNERTAPDSLCRQRRLFPVKDHTISITAYSVSGKVLSVLGCAEFRGLTGHCASFGSLTSGYEE